MNIVQRNELTSRIFKLQADIFALKVLAAEIKALTVVVAMEAAVVPVTEILDELVGREELPGRQEFPARR